MIGKLLLNRGDGEKQIYGLPEGESLSFGSSPDADITILDDQLAPAHCRFTNQGGRITITDLSMRSATIVNGDPITTLVLEEGDLIYLGSNMIGFSIDLEKSPEISKRLEITKERKRTFVKSLKRTAILALIILITGSLAYGGYRGYIKYKKETAFKNAMAILHKAISDTETLIDQKEFINATRQLNKTKIEIYPSIRIKHRKMFNTEEIENKFIQLQESILAGIWQEWKEEEGDLRETVAQIRTDSSIEEQSKIWDQARTCLSNLDILSKTYGREETYYALIKEDEETFFVSYISAISNRLQTEGYHTAQPHISFAKKCLQHYDDRFTDTINFADQIDKSVYDFFDRKITESESEIKNNEAAFQELHVPDEAVLSATKDTLSDLNGQVSEASVIKKKDLLGKIDTMIKRIDILLSYIPGVHQYNNACEMYADSEFNGAKEIFEPLVADYPDTSLASASAKKIELINTFFELYQALKTSVQNREKRAITLYDQLDSAYPNRPEDPDLDSALKKIADFYENKEKGETFFQETKYAQAVEYISKALDIFDDEELREKLKSAQFELRYASIKILCDSSEYHKALEELILFSSDRTLQKSDKRRLDVLYKIIKGNLLMREITDETRGMKMILVEANTFTMGNDHSPLEAAHPAHRVTITEPFYMDIMEVTNKDYELFDPSHGEERLPDFSSDNHPATNVTFEEAVAFTEWLSEQEKIPYSLPTEAQWEMAAKGGHNADFSTSKINIDSEGPSTIEGYRPNPAGLFHMCGNIWEFCIDWLEPHKSEYLIDPKGVESTDFRVIKGGSYVLANSHADERKKFATTYGRNGIKESEAVPDVGFRCISTIYPQLLNKLKQIENNLE